MIARMLISPAAFSFSCLPLLSLCIFPHYSDLGVDMQLENIVLVIYDDVMRHIILARAHKRPA